MEKKKKETKNLQVSESPMALMKMAVDKGTDLDKLEKILIIRERWEANEARKAYNKAMSEFKANPPKISKDRTVKYKDVKYNHASLHNVVEKISSELSKYDLSAAWSTKQNGGILVTCKITHKQGHSEETTLIAQPDTSGSKNSIQAIGSTITYLERYTLLALTGLATFDQDDDGQAAANEYIDEKQKNTLLDMIGKKDVTVDKLCTAFKIEKIEDLPKSKFNQAMTALKARKDAK